MRLTVVQEQIYQLLQNFPLRFFTALEVSQALGSSRQLKQDTEWSLTALKHLAELELIERTEADHFRFLGAGEVARSRGALAQTMRRLHAAPRIGEILRRSGVHYDGQVIEIPDPKQTLAEGIEALKQRFAHQHKRRS